MTLQRLQVMTFLFLPLLLTEPAGSPPHWSILIPFPFNGMLLLVYNQLLILHFTQDLKPHRLVTSAQVLKMGFSPWLI